MREIASVTPHFRRVLAAALLGVAAATSLAGAAGKPGCPDKVLWRGVSWAVFTFTPAP